MTENHDDVIREKKLPRVGDTVKSRKYGTLWRVIEKKEVWENTSDLLHLIPAIYLTYRKIELGSGETEQLTGVYCPDSRSLKCCPGNLKIAEAMRSA